MDNETLKRNGVFPRRRKTAFNTGMDAMGFGFAALALFAVLVAGITIYRSAHSFDAQPSLTVAAASQVTPRPAEPPPMHVHIEGVNP